MGKLEELIKEANTLPISQYELEQGRIEIAAANGGTSDDEITVDTVRAAHTIIVAAESRE